MLYQICALVILMVFYTVYLGKMLSQKRKGIRTDQMARGKKTGKVLLIESVMKVATYSIVITEVLSIFLDTSLLPVSVRIAGLFLGAAGTSIFATAVWTMRDSWRAGIPEQDRTEIVTAGIFQYSRNPAFLGFNLVYIGLLLAFFNWVLLVFTLLPIIMLHLQILQEEAFLPTVFGQSYLDYKAKVRRYFGRR